MFKVVGYTFMKNLDDTVIRVKIGDNFKVNNYQEAISILEKVKNGTPIMVGYLFTLEEY